MQHNAKMAQHYRPFMRTHKVPQPSSLSMQGGPNMPFQPFPVFSANTISKEVKLSIEHVRRLRIILTSLMNSVSSGNLDDSRERELVSIRIKESQEQILLIFESLKNFFLEFKMRIQASTPPVELSVHTSLNLLNTTEQLETMIDDMEDGCTPEGKLRRMDLLSDKPAAIRWLNRNRDRTKMILTALKACSSFKRSTRQPDWEFRRSQDTDFGDLIFTPISSVDPRNYILHIKIPNIMHCLITFRMKDPEHIIIRGLDESMVVRPDIVTFNVVESAWSDTPSYPESLLIEEPGTGNDLTDIPSRNRSHAGPRTLKNINASQLDLFTPSKHHVFQRITDIARCAILYFASSSCIDYKVDHLYAWLAEYRNLYRQPCHLCDKHFGQAGNLPVYRLFDNPRIAQHEFCHTKQQ